MPKELAIREWDGDGPHPLEAVDLVIAGSFRPGFVKRMAARGVVAVATSETDPVKAVSDYVAGVLAVGP